MTDPAAVDALMIALVGGAVVATVLVKALCDRLRIPSLVGYLLIGFLLRLADQQWHFLTDAIWHAFGLLANLGIVALLFKVGLASHPSALAAKLPQAVPVWCGDVLVSAFLGFAAAYWLLGVALLPSLFISTALSATSVGVSIATWEEAGALGSPNGQLILDVAELDDVSAMALMAVLFAVTPILVRGDGGLGHALVVAGGGFTIKFVLFIGFCVAFSRWAEPRLTDLTSRIGLPPQRMLVVAAVGMLIAALADWLGFSFAVGALFAGLVFSRDPVAVRTEASFEDLYAFLTPFFFISIGLHVVPAALTEAAWVGGVLIAAAVVGKWLGAGLPVWFTLGGSSAVLIGASMIPRAEIAMVVMHHGQRLGGDAIPEPVYAGMVVVTAVTCIAGPLMLAPLLLRWPQSRRGGEVIYE
jgi:Na+:H+ antiporter